MQSRALTSMRPVFRNIAMTLVIGAVGTHIGHASALDLVNVTVEAAPVSPSGKKKCSDPQAGDATGNLNYVICADPYDRDTNAQRPHNDVAVQWNLSDTTGKSWVFPLSQGIVIDGNGNKSNSNGGKQKWTITQAMASSYTATTDKKDQKNYGYTINVISGNYLLTYDPTIKN